MKNIKFISLFMVMSLGMLYAQTSFSINPFPKSQPLKLDNSDTLKILAVMVEFKEDNDGNTFGNGKFGSIYSQDYGNDILDPLPFDAPYFRSHLEFAQNYFTKVSNGKFNISYRVLPNVITVSKIMREYSPDINSDDFTPLGQFSQEVWGLADAAYPDVDFSQYDLFTIFHAGVGREIPTPGSLGLERDLPSVYLGENGFKKIFGDNFNGFDVNNGNAKITNTMILPCTENREIESFGDVYLQELTINGLIVSSIASHLGLPDLFNTETGTSAIGRFGLMDGQAIFAYRGVFPPEPSPWEKMYLGWIDPVELNLEDQKVTLTAAEIASAADTSYVKIPVSSSEYYLVENRKRDANKDGVTLTYRLGNARHTITFQKDTETFSPFSVDTLAGVIVNVDEFDWAVPAFEDEQTFDDPFKDVGMIIWHIDESVINNNITSNTVNNNRAKMGVRVVEADGIFDIGEEFTNIFGETVLGEGSKQDTWYSSNPANLYENKFNFNTEPPAVTNSGANSLVALSNFSDISVRASFYLSFMNSGIKVLAQKKLELNVQPEDLIANENFVSVRTGNDIYNYDLKGDFLSEIENFSTTRPSIFKQNEVVYFAGVDDNILKVTETKEPNLEVISSSEINFEGKVSTPVIVKPGSAAFEILFGTETGNIFHYRYDGSAADKFTLVDEYNVFNNKPVMQVIYFDNIMYASSADEYWISDNNQTVPVENGIVKMAVAENSNKDNYSILLTADNRFLVYTGDTFISSSQINTDETINDFAVTDLKADGNNYIVYSYGNKIEARNLNGSRAELFPVQFDNALFNGSSNLAVDVNNNSYGDILSFGSDGTIYSSEGNTAVSLSGFPVSSGAANAVHPAVNNDGQIKLAVLNEDNVLFIWSLGTESELKGWTSSFANNYNNAFAEAPLGGGTVSEYFPADKAYNWPNPVYDNETYFRFYVFSDSKVKIKIFDLAGDLVDEISADAAGGLENEVTWNVENIQSGVYFAHLEVNGGQGNNAAKIIKVAVIK